MTSTQEPVYSSAFTEAIGPVNTRPHRVLIVDSDPRWATAVEKRVDAHPRFEVVAVTGSAAHGADLIEQYAPAAIMLSAELSGMSGIDALAIFQRLDSECEIVLLSQGNNARELASRFGVFGSVSKFRAAEEFDGIVNRLATFLDQPNRPEKQRRTGEDRRKAQDWNKVTSERRQAERRNEDVGYIERPEDARPPVMWDGQQQPPAKGFY